MGRDTRMSCCVDSKLACKWEGHGLVALYAFYFSLLFTKHFLFIHIQEKLRITKEEVGLVGKNNENRRKGNDEKRGVGTVGW